MKVRLGTLKRIIREAAMHEALGTTTFNFEVYGPDDETYTLTASYNPRTPYDIEVWRAMGPSGEEVDVDTVRSIEPDLEAKAFDNLPGKDDDGIGPDYDDIYGKPGIDY